MNSRLRGYCLPEGHEEAFLSFPPFPHPSLRAHPPERAEEPQGEERRESDSHGDGVALTPDVLEQIPVLVDLHRVPGHLREGGRERDGGESVSFALSAGVLGDEEEAEEHREGGPHTDRSGIIPTRNANTHTETHYPFPMLLPSLPPSLPPALPYLEPQDVLALGNEDIHGAMCQRREGRKEGGKEGG